MKYVWLAACVSACTLAAQSDPATGSISGRVLDSRTGAPLRKANVQLLTTGNANRSDPLTAETASDGSFEFTAIPPGDYILSADRTGFLRRIYKPSGDPGVITLGPSDHLRGLEIRLPPQGVITGRVLDEDGDPVPGVQVTLLVRTYQGGRRVWAMTNLGSTNDIGEYRIAAIVPGRYLLQVINRRPVLNSHPGPGKDSDKPEMIFAPVYYPNAATEQAAAPVEVGVGAQLQGMDIHVFKSPGYHVRGTLALPSDFHGAALVTLYAEGSPAPSKDAPAQPPEYRFDLRGVLAGQYTMIVNAGSGSGRLESAQTLTVSGNVSDVLLTPIPVINLTGRITLAEDGAQADLGRTIVNLRWIGGSYLNGMPGGRSDADGKLSFPLPYTAGRYSVEIQNMPDNCFLQKVKVGGQEFPSNAVEITTPTPLEVVLSTAAGKINATVTDKDGKPVEGATAVLVPNETDGPAAAKSTGKAGDVTFAGLRPGAYKLFAWNEIEPGAWDDPEFRKPYEDRAVEVKVGPSETKSAQIRVIPAGEAK